VGSRGKALGPYSGFTASGGIAPLEAEAGDLLKIKLQQYIV